MPGFRGRIEEALTAARFSPSEFERCATDLLTSIYPGLSPVSGGTDFGRDADVHDGQETPARLFVTSGVDVLDNVRTSFRSLQSHGVAVKRIVVATSQPITGTLERKIRAEAAANGATVVGLFGRPWFVERLSSDPEWRHRLLGLRGELEGLAERPLRLDLSDGGRIPLVGREAVLAQLSSATGDLIVIGLPGVGKTRLLAELEGSRFVVETSDERVADAIRRVQPKRVVVDDARGHESRIEMLQQLRSQEGLAFSIVAVGWPGDDDDLQRSLPYAEKVVVDPLEPPNIDAIVRELGISGIALRSEILDQARGRAGWAVALALLTRAGDLRSLLSGGGLVSEVEPYLRRVGQTRDAAIGVLAIVGVVGGVRDDDLDKIATVLQISPVEIRSIVREAATGGLLDPVHGAWVVQPDALRRALVASWFFERQAAWPLASILAAWPGRRSSIIGATIQSAAVGSAGARRKAEELIVESPGDTTLTLPAFARLDESAARRALRLQADIIPEDPIRLEILKVGAAYLLPDAIQGLLSRSLDDDRPLHSYPDHPLRVLSELGTSIHPDYGTRFHARGAVLREAEEWVTADPTPERWIVYARLAAEVLDPSGKGGWLDPVDRRTFQFANSVEPPARMRVIGDELWPLVRNHLDAMPDAAVAKVLDLVESWLHIAGGFGGRLGQNLPPEAVAAASTVASRMAGDVAASASRSTGLAQRLAALDDRHQLGLGIVTDEELDLLTSRPWDARGHDAGAEHIARLQALGRAWSATADPQALFIRIAELRRQGVLAGRDTFASTSTALTALAAQVEDPVPWAEAAVNLRVCGEAAQLVARAAREQPERSEALLPGGLETPCRAVILNVALSAGMPTGVSDLALTALRAEDAQTIEWIVTPRTDVDDVVRRLLVHPIADIRAATALSFDIRGHGHGPPITDDIRAQWRAAYVDSRSGQPNSLLEHRLVDSIEALVETDPELVADWLLARLSEVGPYEYFRVLPFHAEGALSKLPRETRSRIIRSLPSRDSLGFILGLLQGEDAAFVATLLHDGVVTPEDVLHALSGSRGESFLERRHEFEAIGPILLEAGVAPESVVSTAEFGTEMGEDSARYARRVEYFEGLAASGDHHLATLGQIGARIYSGAQVRAAEAERRARILRRD